ncbi:MAG: hypothetical protein ACI8RZ_000494 [Myxococcota bacterium]|jgi:hypothetical protein
MFSRWLLQSGILTDDLPDSARVEATAMRAAWKDTSLEATSQPLSVTEERLAFYWLMRHWHVKDPHDKVVDLWLRCAGPVFTLEVLQAARAFFYTLEPPEGKEASSCHGFLYDEEVAGYIRRRRFLAYCDQPTWEAALQRATSLRAKAPDLRARVMLSFCFPEQADWGNEDIDALIDAAESGGDWEVRQQREVGGFLLASGASLAQCMRLDFGYDNAVLRNHNGLLYCLLDRLGVAAWPMLKMLRNGNHYAQYNLYDSFFGEVSAHIVSPAVAEDMVANLERWVPGSPPEPDIAYLSAYSGLSRSIVEAAIARADGATPRLSALVEAEP